MRPDLLADVLSGICEAALKPEEWPRVLQGVAKYLGADGAAYIMSNKHTARVECICLAGPAVGRQHEYVNHFAALDPYHAAASLGGDCWRACLKPACGTTTSSSSRGRRHQRHRALFESV